MKSPLLIYLLIFVLLLTSVYATPSINVSQNPLLVQTNKNNNIEISFNITNTGTVDIYNLTFTSLTDFNFTTIASIPYNTTYNYTFNVKPTQQVSETRSTVLKYYYLVDEVISSSTYIIDVGSAGFSEYNKTVKKGDTITYHNIDTATNHTITQVGGGFEYIIEPNATVNITYSTEGLVQVYDRTSDIGAYVNVVTNIQQVPSHSPEYDYTLTVQYDVLYNPAVLTDYYITPINYSMQYNKEDSGVLLLRANDTIYDVHLESEWIEFEENDFNVDKNTNKLVNYVVNPDVVTENNYTGIEYNKTITITSENAPTYYIPVSVFIEFYDFSLYGNCSGLTIQETVVNLDINGTLQYCSQNPDKEGCKDLQKIPVYEDAIYIRNYTEDELMALETSYMVTVPNRLTRLENGQLEQKMSIETTLGTFNDGLNVVRDQMTNLTNNQEQVRLYTEAIDKKNEDLHTQRVFIWVWTLIAELPIICYFLFKSRYLEWKRKRQ